MILSSTGNRKDKMRITEASELFSTVLSLLIYTVKHHVIKKALRGYDFMRFLVLN